MRNIDSKFVFLFILVVIFIIISATAFVFNNLFQYIWLLQLAALIAVILYYRASSLIMLFLVFIVPYFYTPKYFFVNGINISHHASFQNGASINFLILLNLLFLAGFLLGCRKIVDSNINRLQVYGMFTNPFIFHLMNSILIFALLYGLQGENVFVSGGYYQGEVSKSTLHEYFIAFYLLAALFANPKSKFDFYVLILFYLFYVLKTLIYGGRIEVLQLSILVFFLFTNIFRGNKLKFYLLLGIGFFLSYIVAAIRSDPFIILEPMKLFSISETDGPEIISSQFGDVNQSSLRVLGLMDVGGIELEQRFLSFMSVVFGFFLPSSYMPDYFDLAQYKQNEFTSGGGGLISAFSYVWLSFFGPAFFGFFVGSAYRFLYHSNNILLFTYGLLVAITFPRWFAYYPINLFKFCLLPVIFLFIYIIIQRSYVCGLRRRSFCIRRQPTAASQPGCSC